MHCHCGTNNRAPGFDIHGPRYKMQQQFQKIYILLSISIKYVDYGYIIQIIDQYQ